MHLLYIRSTSYTWVLLTIAFVKSTDRSQHTLSLRNFLPFIIYVCMNIPQHLEWVSNCCLTPIQHIFFSTTCISWREQVNFQWDDDAVRFVLDQHVELDFWCASWLKQQSVDRHIYICMSLHPGTLFWFRANQSLHFLLNA